eukprot:CAMPEP_0198238918 /NCGR_PEP_ID=MMETSP1446-20131203/4452_1 /TAXON_ID=1461542 ORGANISM="Unidentified sp, Strain CCMP2111" /NCGR_SAMPLE_ID=MMETSP1446 /ASSEMBLY_ACC=CAM_ASM_001112 /LENGTH=251 /DNA_ID=CAMNT_0043921419 /DNA_START=223 /DNA_END=978 /DNA_ORIENTATION=+
MVNVPEMKRRSLRGAGVLDEFSFPSLTPGSVKRAKVGKPVEKGAKYVDVLVPELSNDFTFPSCVGENAQGKTDHAIVPDAGNSLDKFCDEIVSKQQSDNFLKELQEIDFSCEKWSSPFDLDLDVDNILCEWEQEHQDEDIYAMCSELCEYSTTRDSELSPVPSVSGGDQASVAVEQEVGREDSSSSLTTLSAEVCARNRQRCLERYRVKKRNRKFGKKVRYHLRKANADRRPRYKGRFIKKGEVIPVEAVC